MSNRPPDNPNRPQGVGTDHFENHWLKVWFPLKKKISSFTNKIYNWSRSTKDFFICSYNCSINFCSHPIEVPYRAATALFHNYIWINASIKNSSIRSSYNMKLRIRNIMNILFSTIESRHWIWNVFISLPKSEFWNHKEKIFSSFSHRYKFF